MHRELEKCERALTEYLDMKKNVFPRSWTHLGLDLLVVVATLLLPPDMVHG